MLRAGSKCSHTTMYAPLFRHPAPCPEPLSTIFEVGSILAAVGPLANYPPVMKICCIFIMNG